MISIDSLEEVNSFKKSYRLPITIVRSNNIYGTRQYPEKLIPKLIVSILLNKKFPLHGKGKNIRNFVSIKDVTEIFKMVEEGSDEAFILTKFDSAIEICSEKYGISKFIIESFLENQLNEILREKV